MNGKIHRPRVLLLMTPTTYRAADFLGAAEAAGVDIVVGTNRAQTLAGLAPDHNLTLPFDDEAEAARCALAYAARCPVSAVVGVDDEAVLSAARVAAALGVPHNPVAAVAATRSKVSQRQAMAAAGLTTPPFLASAHMPDPVRVEGSIGYPCVIKPASLAGSRGVLRVDSQADLPGTWNRVAAIVEQAHREARQGMEDSRILVEGFLPGQEVALEALLSNGELQPLALFDKPDPMDGPAFAETLFITPSRHPSPIQAAVVAAAQAASAALGLRDGPVHAEFRLDGSQVHLLEVAARTIGGLCSRTLSFGTGMSLEEIVLRHASHLEVPSLVREGEATGVFMIPVPVAGTLDRVDGLDRAQAVPGVVEVAITVPVGEEVKPLPEESTPLGFLFARGVQPAVVEEALRTAHAALEFDIRPATA
jgi:biotin carboxylase